MNRLKKAIITTALSVTTALTIGIAPVSANTPDPETTPMPAVTTADMMSVSTTSVSPASSCTRRGDIIPKDGVWKHVGYTSSRRILNFWTNTKGYSQSSRKVKIGKGVNIDVKGGGSLWTCPDQASWNYAYSHNPLTGKSIAALKQQGLARTR